MHGAGGDADEARLLERGRIPGGSPEWPPYALYEGAGGSTVYAGEQLWIPGVRAVDLIGRWPVVIHDVAMSEQETGIRTRMSFYLHGHPSMLEPLLARSAFRENGAAR